VEHISGAEQGAGREAGEEMNLKKIPIDPRLKAWYEEDILFIDSLLSHLKPGTERYNRLVMEQKRRVELIGNSE